MPVAPGADGGSKGTSQQGDGATVEESVMRSEIMRYHHAAHTSATKRKAAAHVSATTGLPYLDGGGIGIAQSPLGQRSAVGPLKLEQWDKADEEQEAAAILQAKIGADFVWQE